MNDFAFLIATVILLAVWLLLFLRKVYRREMIAVSLFFAPFALLDFFFLQDYWNPQTFLGTQFGIETMISSFLLGGIAAVIYEEFRKLTLVRTVSQPKWILMGTAFVLLANFLALKFVGINSMYALYVVFLASTIFILVRRRDLLMDVVGSGVCFGILYFGLFLIYLQLFPQIVGQWFKLTNTSGILLFGVPLEELLFAFGYGLVAGPLYEVWQGYRLAKR